MSPRLEKEEGEKKRGEKLVGRTFVGEKGCEGEGEDTLWDQITVLCSTSLIMGS